MKNKSELNYKRKNLNKKIRAVFQSIILVSLLILLINTMVNSDKYKEDNKANWNNDRGFITLSYFGIARKGDNTLVSKEQLERNMKSLYDQGYKTISKDDILNFYNNGKPLPKKALYLMFEDGRRDSALFAQPILEKYNYKATMFSYANNLEDKEFKFLKGKEFLKLTKHGFWELGSNGYRLTYINIFDKNNNFINMMSGEEFDKLENVKSYNHYLMDFLRDEDMIPIEDRDEMEKRIVEDYKKLSEVYKEKVGYVPDAYAIMHANSLYNGMNKLVENANSKEIRDTFKINFNKEGNCFNNASRNLYDLNRLQLKSYWYTNHLLMKIKEQANSNVKFVVGEEKLSRSWDVLNGAVEFLDNKIIVTSDPGKNGMAYLKNSDKYEDIKLSTSLKGFTIGNQSIYLRFNKVDNSFVKMRLQDNEIILEEKVKDEEVKELFRYMIDEAVLKSADKNRKVEIEVNKDNLNITLDKKVLKVSIKINSNLREGGVALESKYSSLDKEDNVYDGVFEEVKVEKITENNREAILYYNGYSGYEKAYMKIKSFFNKLADWSIETF